MPKVVYKRQFWIFVLLFSVLLMSYNNCGSIHGGPGFVQVKSTDICTIGEKGLFQNTFHNFAKKNCATCHTSGPGKGFHANENVDTAFSAFTQIGLERYVEFALNPVHQPPYTGSQHQDVMNKYSEQWALGQIELAACGQEGNGNFSSIPDIIKDTGSRIETIEKPINAPSNGNTVTVNWNLNNDFKDTGVSLPNLPGANFEISIKRFTTASGATGYSFSAPTLSNSDVDIHVLSIMIKINNDFIGSETTFHFVDSNIYAEDSEMLSGGTLLAVGNILPSDTISISFGIIEPTTLPPKIPPPTIQFAQTSLQVLEDNGMADITLNLNAPAPSSLTATVEIDMDSMDQLPQDQQVKGLVGEMYNNYDWDYKFQSQTLVFLQGEQSKTIQVTLSKDERDELDENLILRIGSVQGANKGANDTMTIVVQDDDQPYTGFAPTFTQLMSPGGVLYEYCLKCHNSTDRRGGYELSNYDEMITKGVLIPGDTNSKMFRRMNADDPGNANLTPMPLDGFLPEQFIIKVEQWILDGARNN